MICIKPIALLAAVAGFASATDAKPPGTFHITNFTFGCTVDCDFSFDLTISGSANNHPAIGKKIQCKGVAQKFTDTTEMTFPDNSCSAVSATQDVRAYIDRNTILHLQYEVRPLNEPNAVYYYEGQRMVNAETSGKPFEKNFKVKESKASGSA